MGCNYSVGSNNPILWIRTFGTKFGLGGPTQFRSLVFPDLGLGLARFWLNKFKVWAFWMGLSGFEVQFWWTNLGSSEFEAVRSSLYLGSIQH